MKREYEKYKNGFTKVPEYIVNAMQGLAYWIGYKKCLYNYYPLSECAIVSEFSSLLQSGANEDEIVLCERQYCNFFTEENIPEDVDGKRVDLTVAELENNHNQNEVHNILAHDNKQEKGFLRDKAKVVFEVKLHRSSRTLIDNDFKRLKKIKDANEAIVTYLLLVPEHEVPEEFVDISSGHGKKDYQLTNNRHNDENAPHIHVSKVRYVLNQKLDAPQLKGWISQTLDSDEADVDEAIKDQIDFISSKMLSRGAFVCLIEVV